MNKTTKQTLEKGHNLKELISFFFAAKKGSKTETLQKWISVIKNHPQAESDKWGSKIKNGEWITNKFGKKLFFKLG